MTMSMVNDGVFFLLPWYAVLDCEEDILEHLGAAQVSHNIYLFIYFTYTFTKMSLIVINPSIFIFKGNLKMSFALFIFIIFLKKEIAWIFASKLNNICI